MRARLRREADFQSRVRFMHVLLPFGVPQRIPNKSRWSRIAFTLPAHREPLDALAIEAHLQLMRLTEAQNITVKLSSQPDFDDELAVERKEMLNCEATARPERKAFVHPVVLSQHFGALVRFEDW